jgi:hypothetical protein
MGAKLGVALGEEHRLRVSEDGLLRRIFGPKMDDVTGFWRRLYTIMRSFVAYRTHSMKHWRMRLAEM